MPWPHGVPWTGRSKKCFVAGARPYRAAREMAASPGPENRLDITAHGRWHPDRAWVIMNRLPAEAFPGTNRTDRRHAYRVFACTCGNYHRRDLPDLLDPQTHGLDRAQRGEAARRDRRRRHVLDIGLAASRIRPFAPRLHAHRPMRLATVCWILWYVSRPPQSRAPIAMFAIILA